MLGPIILTDDELAKLDEQSTTTDAPSKTYTFDFDTNELIEVFIDDMQAIKQAAMKAIYTNRDRYLIYSSDYGSEIFYLLGSGYSEDYLKLEIPRLVKEALMPDDRIVDAQNFVISKDGDTLNIQFDLITNISNDSITVEVIL
jgi:hypothetical protein